MAQLEKAIDFVPHTAQPQPPVPVDLRNTLFGSIEDVQTATLPKPQLPAVISSYEKTIGESFAYLCLLLQPYQCISPSP